uniref:Uncharacterized protein n=1 Tax=Arundo donax TaxID=35708 RepID=A0A0A8ZQK3_ARUDO
MLHVSTLCEFCQVQFKHKLFSQL